MKTIEVYSSWKLLLGAYKRTWGSKCGFPFSFALIRNLLQIVRGAETFIFTGYFLGLLNFFLLDMEVGFDFHSPYISSCLGTYVK